MQNINPYITYFEGELSKYDFPSKPENLYDPLRYFMQIGGKRLRPVLSLLGAELFNADKSRALPAALAVELFHNFSLIHDDIMDEAPLRRGMETVHLKWNTNIAILSGDVLLVKAYQILCQSEVKYLSSLMHVFNQTAIEVCEGQQMDMDFESRSEVFQDEYIDMIRLKTSVLLGCALKMGAIIAEAPVKDAELLYQFGVELGIAFQIQDDILDLFADPEKFGKQVGGDVMANKKTLLYILAQGLVTHTDAMILGELVNEKDSIYKVHKTKEIYERIGARFACEQQMKLHYNNAMNALKQINVPEESKRNLIELADFLMVRAI
jgi:geranylgeranyl diphosphate synthase type II